MRWIGFRHFSSRPPPKKKINPLGNCQSRKLTIPIIIYAISSMIMAIQEGWKFPLKNRISIQPPDPEARIKDRLFSSSYMEQMAVCVVFGPKPIQIVFICTFTFHALLRIYFVFLGGCHHFDAKLCCSLSGCAHFFRTFWWRTLNVSLRKLRKFSNSMKTRAVGRKRVDEQDLLLWLLNSNNGICIRNAFKFYVNCVILCSCHCSDSIFVSKVHMIFSHTASSYTNRKWQNGTETHHVDENAPIKQFIE